MPMDTPPGHLAAADTAIPVRLQILSAEGQEHAAQPAVRERAAFGSDGILYVAEGSGHDMHVLSYRARLSRAGVYKETRLVPYTTIKTLYERHAEVISSGENGGNSNTVEQDAIEDMLKESTDLRASDIHLVPLSRTQAEVRYRVMGDVIPRFKIPMARHKQLVRTIYDSMADRVDPNYDETADQMGRLRPEYCDGYGLHNARISTGPVEFGPYMAIRLHYDLGEPKTLIEQGLDEDQAADIDDMTTRQGGIIFFSGPTGSGKSTLIANLLSLKQIEANGTRNLITGEDPPELPITGAAQKAVMRRAAGREDEIRGWTELVDTFLRWDPDWLYLSEMRLRATMDAGIKAALSSQLTFTTLHANDASSVQDKLQEAGIAMSYLTDPAIIVGAVNQSLVPILCDHCKKPYLQARDSVSAAQRARIEKYCAVESVSLRGPGCEHCYKGASGREAAAEVIVMDHKYMSLYRDGGSRTARRHWILNGGTTKRDSLVKKINAGRLDPRDAERLSLPLNADDWARSAT